MQSDYGYHIIKREPLDIDGQFENYKGLLVTASAGTMDELLTQWMQEADVQTTETFDEITYQNVRDYLYADVKSVLDAMDAANAAARDVASTDTGDAAGEAATDGASDTTDAAE